MSIIIMILLLGLLIFVHEAGHFFAARMLGIKVSKFALGFPIGPTLWSKKIGDVEYLIHACLLGGYVAFPDDDKDSDLPLDSKERFVNNPVWKRMIVISAGVIMNIVTAFVLVMITAGVWGQLPSGQEEVFIDKIVAQKDESVWQSGLQNSDRILKINGSNVTTSYEVTLFAQMSKQFDGKINPEFAKENLEKLKKLNPNLNVNSLIPAGTEIKLLENVVEPEFRIPDRELKHVQLFGDKYDDGQIKLSEEQITLRDKIEGKSVYKFDKDISMEDLAYALSDNIRPVNITVERDNKEILLKPIYPNKKGLMGISMTSSPVLAKTNSLKSVITGSADYLWDKTYMLCYGFYTIFAGKVNASELHGIVAIAKVGGDVIKTNGIFSGLLLTAIISMDLAILNFLPIPALDGGHFLFLIIEKLRGKPVSEATLEKLSNFFFLLLIILGILIIFNDIYALFMHKI